MTTSPPIPNYATEGPLPGGLVRARRLDDGVVLALRLWPAPADPAGALADRLDGEAAEWQAIGRRANPPGHPAIATLNDWGYDGVHAFMAFELLNGGMLFELLRSAQRRPLAQILALFCDALDGLAFAHEQGLLHGHLTPSSFWYDGTPPQAVGLLNDMRPSCLLDDGHILSDSAGALTLTYALAPERIEGQPYDTRSEVFCLGVLLYELCTGYQPFYAESLAAAYEHLVDQRAAVVTPGSLRPELPEVLSATIMRCLSFAPAERFPDGGELGRVLRGLLNDKALASGQIQAPRLGLSPRRPVPARPAARPPQAAPYLRVLNWRGEVVAAGELTADGLQLGRAADCSLRLDHPAISPYHLTIDWRPGELFARVALVEPTAEVLLDNLQLQPGRDLQWGWESMLQVGPFWLWLDPPATRRNERQSKANTTNGVYPTSSQRTSEHSPGPEINRVIDLRVNETALLTPGQEAQIEVTLVNKGSQNVRVRVEASGQHFPNEIVQAGRTQQALTPKQSGTAWLRVNVPRTHRTLAGVYTLVVRAFDDDHNQEVASQEVRWELLPFSESAFKATPTRGSFFRSGRLNLQVTNRGNSPEQYLLRVEEPEPAYTYRFLNSHNQTYQFPANDPLAEEGEVEQSFLTEVINPGKKGEVRLAIDLPWQQWRWVSETTRPVSTELRAEYYAADGRVRGEIKPARATFQQRAFIPLPWWLCAPLLAILFFLVYGSFRMPFSVFGMASCFFCATPTPLPLPTVPTTAPSPTVEPTLTHTIEPVRITVPLTVTVIQTEIATATFEPPSPTPRPTTPPTATATDTGTPTPTYVLVQSFLCPPQSTVVLVVVGAPNTPYLIYFGDRAVAGGIIGRNGRASVQIEVIDVRPEEYPMTARARDTGQPLALITSFGPLEAIIPSLTCIVPSPVVTIAPTKTATPAP
jgi:pSer/pThr/pTyr-binding forkhead associated (FHA) protein